MDPNRIFLGRGAKTLNFGENPGSKLVTEVFNLEHSLCFSTITGNKSATSEVDVQEVEKKSCASLANPSIQILHQIIIRAKVQNNYSKIDFEEIFQILNVGSRFSKRHTSRACLPSRL